MIGVLQFVVFVGLAIVVFLGQLVAFLDAVRMPASGFTSEGKLTKPIWLALLGVALALGFLGLPPWMLTSSNFMNLFAIIPSAVYWVDVRPRLLPYRRRPGGRGTSGGW